jgi:hypothetical protein
LDQEKLDLIEPPSDLKGESRVAFQQYIYHQQNAESALLEMLEDLDRRDTRSNVVF